MDQLSGGAVVYSFGGECVAASDGFEETVGPGPERESVFERARALACEVAHVHVRAAATGADACWSMSRTADAHIAGGHHVLNASLIPPGMVAAAAVVVVTVKRVEARAAADTQQLRARYRLTPREVEVAGLLAHGASNRQIADRLKLSVNTVQHHAHGVLRKLGVHGRAAVASHLRQWSASA